MQANYLDKRKMKVNPGLCVVTFVCWCLSSVSVGDVNFFLLNVSKLYPQNAPKS